jgi:hypothetical protein
MGQVVSWEGTAVRPIVSRKGRHIADNCGLPPPMSGAVGIFLRGLLTP